MARKATVVVDLGFGDSGKGTTIDTLARRSQLPIIIRFNGGNQAAHTIVTPEGRTHTFSQFGSGMFVDDACTFLSRFVLVNPYLLMEEAKRLENIGVGDALDRLTIDPDALVISPFHIAANRLREYARGDGGHGTCGMGIGETMMDRNLASAGINKDAVIHVRDLYDERILHRKLSLIQEIKHEEFERLLKERSLTSAARVEMHLLEDPAIPAFTAGEYASAVRRFQVRDASYLQRKCNESDLLFEGAQGVLLDEWKGFHPHTTWSTTTFQNALTILSDIAYGDEIHRLGVLRGYYTRHGAGPFVTEDSELSKAIPDTHNGSEGWQGAFRIGWFDFVMARYALNVTNGADALAITNMDRLPSKRKWCRAYKTPGFDHLHTLRVDSIPENLAYQEGLTRLLEHSTPIYVDAPSDDEEYLRIIERELQTPVTIASYGPTALDKRFRA